MDIHEELKAYLLEHGHLSWIATDKVLIGNIIDFFEEKAQKEVQCDHEWYKSSVNNNNLRCKKCRRWKNNTHHDVDEYYIDE